MAHLTGFGLENFRVFKKYTWFDFAPITILVGPNNSGKSSLIKALLLLKANRRQPNYLEFNNGDHGLISFKRVINSNNKTLENSDVITFNIPIFSNDTLCLLLKYQYVANSNSPQLIYSTIAGQDGDSNDVQITKYPEAQFNANKKVSEDESSQKLFAYLSNIHYLPMTKANKHIQAVEINTYDHEVRSSNFFKKWTENFGFIVTQTMLNESTGKSQINVNGILLSEVGTGIQQIIALLIFIVNDMPLSNEDFDEIAQNGGPILILEEPEANLHPKFQSILADMIAEARKKFKIQFIVETHSEYLIRKLQYLTAKGDMKLEDVVIYYFNDPNNVPAGEKQVKKINILEDGSLSDDFGPGFYDEAANWELELLKLKRNKNRQN